MKHNAQRSSTGGLVYSTELGRTCPKCRQAVDACTCKRPARPAGDGVVRVSRETKGRAGKGVTLVSGLDMDDEALVRLSKQLKAVCGAGGTVKEGRIEIQGDHVERVIEQLQAQLRPAGRMVKRAGG